MSWLADDLSSVETHSQIPMTNAVSVAITIAIISRQVLFLLLLQKAIAATFLSFV